MNREQIVAQMEAAEQRCRLLFDQLQTVQAQEEELKTELERTRGDYRTLQRLAQEWPQPAPDTEAAPADLFPGGEHPHTADAAAPASDGNRKTAKEAK